MSNVEAQASAPDEIIRIQTPPAVIKVLKVLRDKLADEIYMANAIKDYGQKDRIKSTRPKP